MLDLDRSVFLENAIFGNGEVLAAYVRDKVAAGILHQELERDHSRGRVKVDLSLLLALLPLK